MPAEEIELHRREPQLNHGYTDFTSAGNPSVTFVARRGAALVFIVITSSSTSQRSASLVPVLPTLVVDFLR
jgi:hypothetical protein